MDDHAEQQPERVDGDVTLASDDLLVSVETPVFSAFAGPDRLTVDDRRGGRRLPTDGLPDRHPRGVVDRLPRPVLHPGAEDRLDRLPGPKTPGDVSPLTAGPVPVQDRVDVPSAVRSRPAAVFGGRHELPNPSMVSVTIEVPASDTTASSVVMGPEIGPLLGPVAIVVTHVVDKHVGRAPLCVRIIETAQRSNHDAGERDDDKRDHDGSVFE